MKKTNGQSGITLIALVVTIVVLLILAGITVAYVLADGGLFDSASKAAIATEKAAIMDYVTAAQATLQIEKYAPSTPARTPAEIFTSNFPASEYTITATGLTSTDKGLYSGSATVTLVKGSKTAYTVTFTDGVATITEPSA